MSVADLPDDLHFSIPQEVCRDFERSSRLEWLDTNHTGAYAMGTAAGVNTRRYHSLLIASLNPPADRYSILSRVEEQLTVGSQTFDLATAQYPGVVHPQGFRLLEEFRLRPFPTWRYRAGPATLLKTVCVLDHQQAVLVRYETSVPCRLEVRILLSFRDYHSLTHQNTHLKNEPVDQPGRLTLAPYSELPPVILFHSGNAFTRDGIWFLNHEYLRELDRGLDFREDLFSPGSIVFDAAPGQSAWFIATLDPARFESPLAESAVESIVKQEAARRESSTLRRALDEFRVVRSDGKPSLLAGYPWFTDWSRDTLISLPALSAAGFPPGETKQILSMLLEARSQGLVPNRFSDTHSAPEYNTADATLWLFVAADHFVQTAKDLDTLRDILYPAALDILEWHYRGTHYNIHVDPSDRLLSAGGPGTQLTWMDAKVRGVPVTSRFGKAVEINALWYNAVKILARWSAILNLPEEQKRLDAEADIILASFRQTFWNEARGCLYDVVAPESRDGRIRPNQLFALSLPFPLLDREQARSVVSVVQKDLLTPVGIRTLEPGDPDYRPRFEGAPEERDSAYHQGTVWPWLIGPFLAAYIYAYGESQQTIAFCRTILIRVQCEWNTCCLGSLSEVYDAEAPYRPGGCPAQLWSVAQLIAAANRLYPGRALL